MLYIYINVMNKIIVNDIIGIIEKKLKLTMLFHHGGQFYLHLHPIVLNDVLISYDQILLQNVKVSIHNHHKEQNQFPTLFFLLLFLHSLPNRCSHEGGNVDWAQLRGGRLPSCLVVS